MSKSSIPIVKDYGLPVRTYVAPQEEKNVQKIYDLDQEEAPIVEKILPYNDLPETSVSAPPLEKNSSSPSLSSERLKDKEGVKSSEDKQKDPVPPALPASKEELIQKPGTQKSSVSRPFSDDLSDHLGKKNAPGVTLFPSKKAPNSLGRRPQIGPIFSDLNRAKEFLVRLKAQAEGYEFTIQSRAEKGKMMYRIVTKKVLDSKEVKKLSELIPTFIPSG
ncbi:hypothetical protein [Holospora curviuscula]|nr:hypothetical protein [Holospora curviuscula]